MNKKLIITSVAIFILTVLLVTIGLVGYNTLSYGNKILKGVCIDNEDVGGMTIDEAKDFLTQKYSNQLNDKEIKLGYEEKEYIIKLTDLEAKFGVDDAVSKAFEYGKTGNIITRTKIRNKLKKTKVNISVDFIYDESKLGGEIKKIADSINSEAANASITLTGGRFNITPDKKGIKLNEEKLIDELKTAIRENTIGSKLALPVEVIEAKITEAILKKIDSKISSFNTSFSTAQVNRSDNIRIATRTLNGTLVMPGEVFSMNKVLGPRTAAKGYKDAPIFQGGKVVPGMAGGICQVNTTMYNAVLLADLEVVERHPHGLTVSYVPAGRDASISGNATDLKFKNTYKTPIYVQGIVEGGILSISLYSANERPGLKVEISSEVYEKVNPPIEYIKDPSLKEGAKVVESNGALGIKSRAYIKVYENGKLIKSKLLSQDYYKPKAVIIRIGTKKVSEVPPTDGGDSSTEGNEDGNTE